MERDQFLLWLIYSFLGDVSSFNHKHLKEHKTLEKAPEKAKEGLKKWTVRPEERLRLQWGLRTPMASRMTVPVPAGVLPASPDLRKGQTSKWPHTENGEMPEAMGDSRTLRDIMKPLPRASREQAQFQVSPRGSACGISFLKAHDFGV